MDIRENVEWPHFFWPTLYLSISLSIYQVLSIVFGFFQELLHVKFVWSHKVNFCELLICYNMTYYIADAFLSLSQRHQAPKNGSTHDYVSIISDKLIVTDIKYFHKCQVFQRYYYIENLVHTNRHQLSNSQAYAQVT